MEMTHWIMRSWGGCSCWVVRVVVENVNISCEETLRLHWRWRTTTRRYCVRLHRQRHLWPLHLPQSDTRAICTTIARALGLSRCHAALAEFRLSKVRKHWLAAVKVKVKFSHTRYRALGPELIPVYRQSARRWREVNHAIDPQTCVLYIQTEVNPNQLVNCLCPSTRRWSDNPKT